jgi:type IV secretion system protein VirD4
LDAAPILLFGGVFVFLAIYYFVGGIGGVLGAAASRRAMAASNLDRREAPAPSASLGSIASAPGQAASAGFSRAGRLASIERTFANDLTPLIIHMKELTPLFFPASAIERLAAAFVEQVTPDQVPEGDEEPVTTFLRRNERDYLARAAVGAIGGASFRRTLRELSESERHAVRLAHILEVLGVMSAQDRLMATIPLVWNDGDCALLPGGSAFHGADRRAKLRAALDDVVTGYFGKKGAAMERVESALRRALDPHSMVSADDRAVLERHLFAGARWLSPQDDYSNLEPNGDSPTALRFGPFHGTDREMFYDAKQSIFSIAGPGTGKSLMLMRNLVSCKGGAVVLDVKGELYEATAGWRRRNVGPVYRYDPAHPDLSMSFNPLDWVRADDFAYEDATILARALTFPKDKEDYWDLAGIRAIATALAKTALQPGRNSRTVYDAVAAINDIGAGPSAAETDTFDSVFDRSKPEVQEWVNVLFNSGQAQLYDEARTLLTLPARQRSGVLEVARNQLTAWGAGNVYNISTHTDLRGDDLRGGPDGPATLYITIDIDRIDYYRSTIRALLSCLYRDLTKGVPDRKAPAVTFFIDEMVRLKRMDILETGLATGRGYGVRFWFFAQDVSLIEQIYKEATTGMVEQCAVRMYMNPSEGKAQVMSRNISEREGLLEGRRKPLADPADLYGPEFRDSIIVMSRANFPARLSKVYPTENPNDDPDFTARLHLPLTEI